MTIYEKIVVIVPKAVESAIESKNGGTIRREENRHGIISIIS